MGLSINRSLEVKWGKFREVRHKVEVNALYCPHCHTPITVERDTEYWRYSPAVGIYEHDGYGIGYAYCFNCAEVIQLS